ncbi:MAG: hypothetical protein RQ760_18635 [Sedimentisphaerales bacterium]|nr:hypothetical protein [Sedimentisphaerales bacterium]
MDFTMPNFGYLKYEIKGFWERLAIRDWLSRSPVLIIGASAILLLGVIAFLVTLTLPEEVVQVDKSEKQWFYDLNHQSLFTVKSGQLPPIEAPSGPLANGAPAGARAYVFTYSDDPNTTDTFIGFLETIDPNVDKGSVGLMDLRVPGAETFSKGRLIRRIKDKEWVEANSEEGRAILKEVFRKNESGKIPEYIAPK